MNTESMLKMDSSKFSNNEIMVHVTDDNSAREVYKDSYIFTFLINNGKYVYHNL
jgi:hypothetical protein